MTTYHIAPSGSSDGDGTATRPLDVDFGLSHRSPARPGDTIVLRAGVYEGQRNAAGRKAFFCPIRGAPGRPITIQAAQGDVVHLNGWLELAGSHLHIQGLEIGDLGWNPASPPERARPAVVVGGAKGSKLINCNVFGGFGGVYAGIPAEDFEVYGCLIHDVGRVGPHRGDGAALYLANQRGTKRVTHNVGYRGCWLNLQAHDGTGALTGLEARENIMYVAGSGLPDQGGAHNYLVVGAGGSDQITLAGNVGYQPATSPPWRPNLKFGSYSAVANGTGVIKDNYLIGACHGMVVDCWRALEVTGNTVWARDTAITLKPNASSTGTLMPDHEESDPRRYRFDHNTFPALGCRKGFIFLKGVGPGTADEQMTLSKWQSLGMDSSSLAAPGQSGKPTGTKIFVFPNRYEVGRAHVGIFDWDENAAVEVDLSTVLRPGQVYRIYNCLDIRQTLDRARPVVRGQYDGQPVSFPMQHSTLSPEFDAFLVLPAH